MKQAILITAYKDFEQLKDLIREFDKNFNIYIHLDKKSTFKEKEINLIRKNDRVKFFDKKYKINWGGINHLKSYLLLAEKALMDVQNTHFHLITGQDYPIKNTEYFKKLLFNNTEDKLDYLEYFKMSVSSWENGGMDRLVYYNFYDLFNFKSFFGKKCIHLILKIQKKLNFKRSIKFTEQLYGGSTYWTLSRNTLQFVIDFTKQNPVFFKRFKYTSCAEEIYFQTVIMNSEFSKNVINDNLRFIDWNKGEGYSPAYLEENDYETIVASNKLFARKIDSTKKKLKQMLINHIKNADLCAKPK